MNLENEIGAAIFTAGDSVPAGIYKHLDSAYCLKLEGEDTLPARLDGHVTCYARVHTWDEFRLFVPQAPLPQRK